MITIAFKDISYIILMIWIKSIVFNEIYSLEVINKKKRKKNLLQKCFLINLNYSNSIPGIVKAHLLGTNVPQAKHSPATK